MNTGKIALGTATLLSFGLAAPAQAQQSLTADANSPRVVRNVAGSVDKSTRVASDRSGLDVYIVELDDAALASYRGGVSGYAATSPVVTLEDKLDVSAPASVDYLAYLNRKHTEFGQACDTTIGRHADMVREYKTAFNGMAIRITEREARMIRNIPGVRKVTREEHRYPLTDVGPAHIGSTTIWTGGGDYSGPSSLGEGAVVAILDTGINSDHPAFADVGGDFWFNHTNPLGSGNYIPGSYCDTVDPTFCNDKLIGAWDMVQSPDDPTSPEDSDGHGSHTAGTVAGNIIYGAAINAPTTSIYRDLSGVAPHANIIAYDVCITSCPGSALLAAVNQVVIDASALPKGIHALNYSISGGNDPYNDPVELAFLNATEAGVFVSASAGNSGPGAATVAHNGPWVATVAALTHGRRIDNSLTGFSSDGSALGDILGAGFTTAYGPAAIVHASDFPTSNGSQNDTDPAQCLDPFPAGTFNGEIVVCDRGSIARVEKGANVLAGGAGGFVLANTAAQGESVSADAHLLPGVHVGFTDGEALRAWLASESNTVASIAGTTVTIDDTAGDIMAGFSSRGPNTAIDVLKPDMGAPGVSILAPVNNGGRDGTTPAPEYGFLSGTSMSSPHNAGAGALINFLTFWSPYQIRSAMMMTAKRAEFIRKEDGTTPADPFDTGAGRISLHQVLDAGLVLDETPENFRAADPNAGGDPKTLNLASMMDSTCLGTCSWTRTVKNVAGRRMTWDLHIDAPAGVGYTISPKTLTVDAWAEASFTVTMTTYTAPAGWQFADLKLTPRDSSLPQLHMPIAVQPATATSPSVFTKSVDRATAAEGDTLTYTVQALNSNSMSGAVNIVDTLPDNFAVDPASITEAVSNGTTTSPASYDASTGQISWSGTLNQGNLTATAGPSPFGFIPLAAFGIPPLDCSPDCDEGAIVLDVPTFTYNGSTYNQVMMSMNGTLEPGAVSGVPAPFFTSAFPNVAAPNNVIAPLWTDLDVGAGGNIYSATLSNSTDSWTVYEWSNVPLWAPPGFPPQPAFSFQVWIQTTNGGGIWFIYDRLDTLPFFAVIGAENAEGTDGANYYANGAGTPPAVGTDVTVSATPGGSATITFSGTTENCKQGGSTIIVNQADLTNDGDTEKAIAVTECSARSEF